MKILVKTFFVCFQLLLCVHSDFCVSIYHTPHFQAEFRTELESEFSLFLIFYPFSSEIRSELEFEFSKIQLEIEKKLKKIKIRIRVRSEIRLKTGRKLKKKKVKIRIRVRSEIRLKMYGKLKKKIGFEFGMEFGLKMPPNYTELHRTHPYSTEL